MRSRRRAAARLAAVLAPLMLLGTAVAPDASAAAPSVSRTIASGLTTPWGVAFLPDGSALVSERDPGVVVRIPAGGGRATTVGRVPGVRSTGSRGGESGLLGIALHPDYPRQPWLYAYLSTATDNRVVRMTYRGGELGRPQVLLSGIHTALHHNGGALVFSPGGMLYVSTGDAEVAGRAQDRASLNGKVLRMTPTGGIPAGNPFGRSYVWSYGHRNVEGLGFSPNRRLWASEFGDKAWDELNRIRAGRNYGWPLVEGRTNRKGLVSPIAQWRTSAASPAGIAIVDDVAYLAALRGQRLLKASLSAGAQGGYFSGTYGRLRNVVNAPDGSLWLLTSNTDGRGSPRRGDDRVLRVTI